MEYYLSIDYNYSHFSGLDLLDFPQVEDIKADVFYYPSNSDFTDGTFIGQVSAALMNYYLYEKGYSIYEGMDKYADTLGLGLELIDEDGLQSEESINLIGEVENQNILIIRELILQPEYRGKGIGKKVMKMVENSFIGKCGVIALKSFPLQHCKRFKEDHDETWKYQLNALETDINKAQSKLDEFYLECGYIRISYTDNSFFLKRLEPMI